MRIGPGRPCFGLDDHGGTANSVANAHCNDTSIFGLLDCKPPLGFDCSRVGRWWPWRCFRGRGSWRRVAAVPAAMPLLHSNHFTNTSGRTPSFCLRRMLRSWSKLRFGKRISDFVFREASGDYLLVELEKPARSLFRKDGQQHEELTDALDQVTDWRRYLEDNLSLPLGTNILGNRRSNH
jgi:hypothetical protein